MTRAAEEESEERLLIPLVGFSALALGLMLAASHRGKPDIFNYALLAFSFLISSWVCLVAMEKSSPIKWLWSFKSTKVISGFLVSIFIFYSSIRSSEMLNEIFSIDSSALVNTKTIGHILYAFSLFAPIFFLYLALAFFVMIKEIITTDNHASENRQLKTIIFFVNGIILGLIGGFGSIPFLDEDTFKKRLEEIANFADFGNHSCVNVDKNLKVLFIGSSNAKF